MTAVATKFRSWARLLVTNPRAIPTSIVAVERYLVYRADPREVPLKNLPPRLEVRKLTNEELQAVADDVVLGFSARKLETTRNTAYGVLVQGELAHISWLIDPEQDRGQTERLVRLRDGEREITHCATADKFRGRGLYPLAISYLCMEASRQGARWVVMMTGNDNAASQRGIEKAGLKPYSRLVRLFLRSKPTLRLTWRGHRWRWP